MYRGYHRNIWHKAQTTDDAMEDIMSPGVGGLSRTESPGPEVSVRACHNSDVCCCQLSVCFLYVVFRHVLFNVKCFFFFLLITPHSPMARKTLWRPRWKRTSLHPASYMPQLHRQRATIHRQAKGQFITNGAQRGAQGSFQISLGFHIPVLGFFRRCRMFWKVTRLPCLSCDGIWRWNYVPGSYVGSIGFKSKAEGMIRLARKPWDHLLLCWRRWKLNP